MTLQGHTTLNKLYYTKHTKTSHKQNRVSYLYCDLSLIAACSSSFCASAAEYP